MFVKDVMIRNPVFVHPELSVHDARVLMQKEKIGRLPVLDKNNKLTGIVTEWDLINASPSQATTLNIYEVSYLLSKLKVEAVMTKSVITVTEEMVIEEAARLMVDNDIGALPVMRGSVLIGIITTSDLFKLFINLFGARQDGLRVTLIAPEEPGELQKIAGSIADKGGNIISLVVCDGRDVTNKTCCIKVSDINKEDIHAAVSPLSVEIIDIR